MLTIQDIVRDIVVYNKTYSLNAIHNKLVESGNLSQKFNEHWTIEAYLKDLVDTNILHVSFEPYQNEFIYTASAKLPLYSKDLMFFDPRTFEEYTKFNLIRNLVALKTLSRRDGFDAMLLFLEKDERSSFIRNILLDHKHLTSCDLSSIKSKYLIDTVDKMVLFFNKIYETITNKNYFFDVEPENISIVSFVDISIEQIDKKIAFFKSISINHQYGILGMEKYIEEEQNPFIKDIYNMFIDGNEEEDIIIFFNLVLKNYIKRISELFEILEIGIDSILNNENPRLLEKKLLTFVEGEYKEYFSYFSFYY